MNTEAVVASQTAAVIAFPVFSMIIFGNYLLVSFHLPKTILRKAYLTVPDALLM